MVFPRIVAIFGPCSVAFDAFIPVDGEQRTHELWTYPVWRRYRDPGDPARRRRVKIPASPLETGAGFRGFHPDNSGPAPAVHERLWTRGCIACPRRHDHPGQ